jgi:hypothetical protein
MNLCTVPLCVFLVPYISRPNTSPSTNPFLALPTSNRPRNVGTNQPEASTPFAPQPFCSVSCMPALSGPPLLVSMVPRAPPAKRLRVTAVKVDGAMTGLVIQSTFLCRFGDSQAPKTCEVRKHPPPQTLKPGDTLWLIEAGSLTPTRDASGTLLWRLAYRATYTESTTMRDIEFMNPTT